MHRLSTALHTLISAVLIAGGLASAFFVIFGGTPNV